MKTYLVTSLVFFALSGTFQFTGITYKEIGIMEGAIINYGMLIAGVFSYLYYVDARIKKARQ